MDADRALKTLFKLRATDLLPVTGDRGAEVVSRQVPELNAVTRHPDFVLKLRRGSEVYLRHLEFETVPQGAGAAGVRVRGGAGGRARAAAAADRGRVLIRAS